MSKSYLPMIRRFRRWACSEGNTPSRLGLRSQRSVLRECRYVWLEDLPCLFGRCPPGVRPLLFPFTREDVEGVFPKALAKAETILTILPVV